METTPSSPKPLSATRIQSVVNDLVASLAANSSQTPSERAEITNRIARRRKLTVQQVAGVRASLTRGSYGNVNTLVRAWRRNNRG